MRCSCSLRAIIAGGSDRHDSSARYYNERLYSMSSAQCSLLRPNLICTPAAIFLLVWFAAGTAVATPPALRDAPAGPPPRTQFPTEEWEEVAPEAEGVDSAWLRAAVDHMAATFGRDGARELVIVRNGRLIWAGPGADAYHTIYSCTKTFTSTLLGILVDEGKCSLDDLAVKYVPGLDDHYTLYGKIRLRHLASMSGGYRGQVVDKRPDQPWGDVMAYLNPREPAFEAGTHVQYNDHDVFILGKILTLLTRTPLQDQFQRRIAGPIGIERWEWGVSGTVDGIPLNNPPGNPGGAGAAGVKISPRDLARFGLLMLNRGNWNGRQLLSPAFVDEATSNRIPLTGGFRNRDFRGRYGFYWWTNGAMIDGRRPWPSAPSGTYMAHGNGGNFCCVVPEWNVVIVRMGAPAPKADQAWEGFFAKVARAFPDA
jgi:CubicO group peptidase (beta-lactamase class C family)